MSCINITPLVLSDTFNTWFQRTNQMISTLNSFGIRGLSAGSSYEGIKLTDTGSCYFEVNLSYGPFVGFVTTGDSGVYGTGDATNPYNLTLKFNGSEPTLSDADLTGNDYFIVSDTSESSLMKKVSASAILGLIPEENRYFYGASAPTASDLMLGDKWFNTTVGSEFTYLYTDDDQDTYIWVDIDHLGQGESGDVGINLFANGSLFASDSTSLNISGGSYITVSSEGSNKYVVALNDPNNLNYVKISGDTMTGTLTGTNASFSNSITASNGFIGTLTGNNIRYTNAEFGTESLIIQGSSATFTDMSVMITGDSTFDINDLSIGTTFDVGNGQNPNVYRIFAQDGVALGGNNLSKNNWFGNNVFLSPHEDHVVLIGLPLSRDASNHEKLTVTGGIVTKRIFATGSLYPGLTSLSDGKAFNTLAYSLAAGITTVDGYETPLFSVQERQPGGGWVNAPKIRRVWPTGERGSTERLDPNFEPEEYVTKKFVNKGHGTNFTIIPWGDSNIQISFIKLTVDTPSGFWIPLLLSGTSSFQFKSQPLQFTIPNYGSYGNIVSISSYVRYSGYSTLGHQFFNDTQKTANINTIATNGNANYVVTIQTNTNPNSIELAPNMEVYFTIISKPS